MEKNRDVEIFIFDKNENCLNSVTLKTFAYLVQQWNTSYRQKGLRFLFK